MNLRNIAIIAHVDHGKTTLVDCLLRQSGMFRANQKIAERALDSNELERERGITILAKCTSVAWEDIRFNIVDTPGHADFGGEVERILSMVDGVLVLVDAAEGPMPQTKFVLGKALALGLRPIVVINKVDRPDARPHFVHDATFDLFAALDANEDQLDFPTIFASAKEGWATRDAEGPRTDITPLFELVRDHVPPPTADADAPFSMLVTTLESDPYLGRLLTGRIQSGRAVPNMTIKALSREGDEIEQVRLTKIFAFRGLERTPLESAEAGDIVAIAGLTRTTVADTVCAPEVTIALPAQPVDPPTLAMSFAINDSPLAGKDGDKLTSRVIRDRLMGEAEGNVAIHVRDGAEKGIFEVAGRGELQLAVLIEQMRREGFELTISRPRVLFRDDPETGERQEPIEEVVVDLDEPYSGVVVEKLNRRRSELIEMRATGGGKQRLVFHAPSRSLIGYHGEFLTDTRGTGVMHRLFHSWGPYRGTIEQRHTGVMISREQGKAVAYALWNLEERGPLFIGPGDLVYGGMIIGEHSRGADLEVNPLKSKQLTNIRASGKDDAVALTTPRRMNLDRAIAYISDSELVEVTPHFVRLRKRYLDPHERKRAARRNAA
ncbi:MAG: translational GTPase TypA [Alphaproteobacteria bacterium]